MSSSAFFIRTVWGLSLSIFTQETLISRDWFKTPISMISLLSNGYDGYKNRLNPVEKRLNQWISLESLVYHLQIPAKPVINKILPLKMDEKSSNSNLSVWLVAGLSQLTGHKQITINAVSREVESKTETTITMNNNDSD